MEYIKYLEMYQQENEHWWFVSRRHTIAETLSQLKFQGRPCILEVGCGTGGNLEMLAARGELIALDMNSDSLAWAREKQLGQLVQANAQHLPLADESVDLVLVLDVMYHVWVDQNALLSEVVRVLKPGGYLLVTEPALNCLKGQHGVDTKARERYTTHSLSQVIGSADLRVQRCEYFFFFTLPMFFIIRSIENLCKSPINQAVKTPHKWVNAFLIWLMKLEVSLTRRVKWPLGSSVIALASKPFKKINISENQVCLGTIKEIPPFDSSNDFNMNKTGSPALK